MSSNQHSSSRPFTGLGLFGNKRSEFERKSVDGCECVMIVRTGFRIIRSICLCFHEAIAPASCFESTRRRSPVVLFSSVTHFPEL